MMNRLRNKTAKGFTLIELMIVIAIIGILAAIAVPNFNRARLQAKKKACTSNMKTIEGAVELYNMENSVTEANVVQTATLSSMGYLKTEPKCPGAGSYTVANKALAGGTGKKTEVTCSIHGDLSEQDGSQKDKGVTN
ncbi:MAG: prepilin-type N-terminal cleavage/methylation domain-containing protein [Candidatus Wallbacteria bacterium]